MNIQERFDELEAITITLNELVEDITDEYYRSAILEIVIEAEKELRELRDDLDKEQYEDERELNSEYERDVYSENELKNFDVFRRIDDYDC